ncbi:sulfatase-like hydrolase/transferase [Halomonas lysinitropha]|uniref:Phosphoglycerol transferase I n=1 Tax=Halomonas lysinitropha TaxID=2607506 RepID=A0A5K1I545_9GAMM|nr:sulfatase-like hydrolase/transferase [Halomonas lysinitropha]VVZ95287.1 phosphoglycerol transferase I [Halomonas lysinitropha]
MSFLLLISLGFFALGCAVSRVQRRVLILPLGGLGLLLAILSSTHVVANHFTGQGVDESVIYHLLVGLEGAGFREYLGIMVLAVVLLMVSLAYGWTMIHLLRWRPSRLPHFVGWASLPLLVLAWGVNPGAVGLVTLVPQHVMVQPEGKLPEAFVFPGEARLQAGVKKPKNLVLIYAESLERTYFDESIFPALVPHLVARQEQALSFTGIEQMPGMWWTMGGKVGSQCGTPLVTASGLTSMSNSSDFLPGARCLGDLLAEQDYTLHYIGGADSEFGGKKSFYKTHGFARIEGLHDLSDGLSETDGLNHWGLQDDETLPLVAERFDELASEDAPFVLATLTLGTHHPKGHVASQCLDSPYAESEDPMLEAVHCSDRLIDDLVEHILGSPYAEETLLVVMSDHTAMRNTVSEVLEANPRRNLFMVLGDDIDPARDDRPGSQLDMAPTLLSLMGFESKALGLGRNLLGDEANFLETHEYPQEALRELYPSLRTLWGIPDLKKGLYLDQERRLVTIGTREFEYPLMLRFDDELAVQEVLGSTAELARLPESAAFLWVDDCQRNTLQPLTPGEVCVVWSNSLAEPARLKRLTSESPSMHGRLLRLTSPDGESSIEILPPLEETLPHLQLGGQIIVDGQPVMNFGELISKGNARVTLEAQPNSGMGFVRWQGVEGLEQFAPKVSVPGEELDDIQPVFDQDVENESMTMSYRSAWAGIASREKGRLAEHLSPGDDVASVARVALWHEDIGSLDLRGFGGFKMPDPRGFIRVNGETLLEGDRGLNLVILDPSGEVVHAVHYDTHVSADESDALAEKVAAVEPNHLVLLASFDEFTSSLTPALIEQLQRLGFALSLPD